MEKSKQMFSDQELEALEAGKLDLAELISNRSKGSATNTSMFFDRDNNEGYFTAEEFKSWLLTLSFTEVKNLELLFEYMSSGQRLNSLPYTRKDREGREYMWCKFVLPHALQDFKVIMGGKLDKFIKHYQQGVIRPNFDLNQLYIEAIKATAA